MFRKPLFLLALSTVACLVSAAQDPQPVTRKSICETSYTLPPHDARTCSFDVPAGLRKARIVGKFSVTGDAANAIEVWLMNDAQFEKWQTQHTVEALYKSQKVTQGMLNFFLTEPGKFHVIFNNDSPESPQTVEASLSLRLVR